MEQPTKGTTDPPGLRESTLAFASGIVRLRVKLDRADSVAKTNSQQLWRSGASVGANVEEACGGASPKDFGHKIAIAGKEARETRCWLRLLAATVQIDEHQLARLIDEFTQHVAILTSVRQKTRSPS